MTTAFKKPKFPSFPGMEIFPADDENHRWVMNVDARMVLKAFENFKHITPMFKRMVEIWTMQLGHRAIQGEGAKQARKLSSTKGRHKPFINRGHEDIEEDVDEDDSGEVIDGEDGDEDDEEFDDDYEDEEEPEAEVEVEEVEEDDTPEDDEIESSEDELALP